MVAGNRVLNEHEIWLHPDGSAHKYLRTATWETLEHGCTQRQYVGPATDEEIILDELLEAINFNIEETGENDSVPVLRSMMSYWARGLSRAWNLIFFSTPR